MADYFLMCTKFLMCLYVICAHKHLCKNPLMTASLIQDTMRQMRINAEICVLYCSQVLVFVTFCQQTQLIPQTVATQMLRKAKAILCL